MFLRISLTSCSLKFWLSQICVCAVHVWPYPAVEMFLFITASHTTSGPRYSRHQKPNTFRHRVWIGSNSAVMRPSESFARNNIFLRWAELFFAPSSYVACFSNATHARQMFEMRGVYSCICVFRDFFQTLLGANGGGMVVECIRLAIGFVTKQIRRRAKRSSNVKKWMKKTHAYRHAKLWAE